LKDDFLIGKSFHYSRGRRQIRNGLPPADQLDLLPEHFIDHLAPLSGENIGFNYPNVGFRPLLI
jgi:hypothetical protein